MDLSQRFGPGFVQRSKIGDCPPQGTLRADLEPPRSASVLKWRQSVWAECHFTPNQPPPITRATRSFNSLKDVSAFSSDDEDDHHRLTRKKTTETARTRSKGPWSRGWRSSTCLRRPLIDLSQPRDPDGRPIQTKTHSQHRIRLSPKLSFAEDDHHTSADQISEEYEHRHRAAMRRLQAEATSQIEQAECEAAARRRSVKRASYNPIINRSQTTYLRKDPIRRLSALAKRSVPNLSSLKISTTHSHLGSPPTGIVPCFSYQNYHQRLDERPSKTRTRSSSKISEFFKKNRLFHRVSMSFESIRG